MKSPIQKTSTYYQRGSTSFSNFAIRAPLRTMRHLVGGRVSEGSGIYLCFCYYFEQAHFVMFSGSLVFLFCEAVILYSLIFKKLHPLFVVLPNLQVGKLKLCLNPVDARLMPCLVESLLLLTFFFHL